MYKKIALLFILLAFVNKVFCQNTFSIKVLNDSNQGISGMVVKNDSGKTVGITDKNGNLSFESNTDSVLVLLNKNEYSYETVLRKNSFTEIVVIQTNKIKNEETVYVFGRKTSVMNADAAVSILNKNAFEKYNPASFVAAFNTVPGVKMDERSPGSYRINIRGNLLRSTFGVRNIKVYLNGLPITDASGNTYFNSLSPAFINNIQIIKGPGGSMYGAGTGGVILMKTENEFPNTNLQISGGSYGMFNASLHKNIVSKHSAATVSLSHQQSDGYRDHSAMRRDVIGYSHSYAGKKNNVTLTTFYSNLFYNTPGGLTMVQLLTNPKQSRPFSAIFKSAKDQKAAFYLSTLYASLSNEITINSKWKNTTGIYFSYTDFKNPTIRNYEKKYERGTGGRTSFQFTAHKWTIISGAEYQNSFINTATHGNKFGVKDTLQYYDKINVNQLNIFSQVSHELPLNMLLTAGISYNSFLYNFFRISPSEDPSRSNFSPQYIPRFSLLKKFKGGSMYVSFSKGYSPPTIDEIHAGNGVFNNFLDAEKSSNYETGIKINLIKDLLYADLSYYFLKLKNTLVGRKDASGGDFFINAGNTKQHGIEFSFTGYPINKANGFIDNIKLQLTGSVTKATFENYRQGNAEYSGNKLTGTSPFTVSLLADVVNTSKFYSNITYTYTDKIPLNDANTLYAKAYNLLFVKIGWINKISKKINADTFVSWMKSFNKNYSLGNDLNAQGARFFNPSALQIFSAGIKLNFIKP